MALVSNKKVHLTYTLEQRFEAGVELVGTEVKSLRAGKGVLEGARILVRGGEAFLVGATIPAWQEKNASKDFDPARPRRLLLTQKELAVVQSAEGARGLTVVPVSFYAKGRVIKLEIAIAKGKKKFDKREDIKKRDDLRRSARER
jgi:SsrA-binding protein